MAIIRGLKTGWHDSTNKIGNWSSPQEAGDDRPRGNRPYSSLDMTYGLSFNGIDKKYDGLNISNGYLTKGECVIFGHSLILEEDVLLEDSVQIILGIDRESRETYIDLSDSKRDIIQEELENDFGKYEVEIWVKDGEEWRYNLPQTATIKKHLQPILIEANGKNIYDIELTSISDNLISNPSAFVSNDIMLTLNVVEIGNQDNVDYLRIRKAGSFLETKFTDYRISLGINHIILILLEDGSLRATTGTGE